MVIGRTRRALWAFGLLVVVALGGGIALAWHPAIAPVAVVPSAFEPATVARGATLAALGDCAVCHATRAGGRQANGAFGGGLALPTPFGIVYATNITPDPATGIGRWSEAAFRRAMRDGIDRSGRHLYPALPYPHFTRATDDDIAALYAFLMTRTPQTATPPRTKLPFPLNIRAVVAGWNLLFLRPGPWQPDATHDATWNRGAYLVEAVGHCGACHTPHNSLGAEEDGHRLGGGESEGWYAPALADAGRPWGVAELEAYLRTGLSGGHGVAGGPMAAVTEGLARVPAADVHAIAVYLASRMPPAGPAAPPLRTAGSDAVFNGACGGCHGADAPMRRAGAPSLDVTAAVNAPTPQSAIRVVLRGIPWREGQAGPYMPGFAATLSDRQLADILGFVRAQYSRGPAWTDLEAQVHRAREEGTSQQ